MALVQTNRLEASSTTNFETFAGQHRLLTVIAGNAVTLTYNGIPLTLSGTLPNAPSFRRYYLANPPVGTYSLVSSSSTFLDVRGWAGAEIISDPFGTTTTTGGGSTGSFFFNSGVVIGGSGNYSFHAVNYFPTGSVMTWSSGTQNGAVVNAFTPDTGGNVNFTTSTQSSYIASGTSFGTVSWTLISGFNSPATFPGMYTVHESFPWATSSGESASVTNTSATLNALVNGQGYSTNTYIEYGLTTSYGSVLPTVATGTGSTTYSQTATGLTPSTLYHYRVVADNGNGIEYGTDYTFTTLANPSTTTVAVTNLMITGATLNATLFNSNTGSTYYFEYGTTTGVYTGSTVSTALGASSSNQNVSVAVSGLTIGIIYYYRVVQIVGVTTYYGSELTFTPSDVPTTTTGTLTTFADTTATLLGTVNPKGLSTNAFFEYGTTTSLGTTTANQAIGSGSTDVAVSQAITGLTANTLYYYRVSGTNTNGTGNGTTMSFTTYGPAIITSFTSTDSYVYDSNTLTTVIDLNDTAGTYVLNYGIAPATYTLSTSGSIVNGSNLISLTGLTEGTTYYCQLVITNTYGVTTSSEISFNTFNTNLSTVWTNETKPTDSIWNNS